MHIQPLGKQTSRIIVKSERKREILAKLEGVRVLGEKVYFPDALARIVESIEKKAIKEKGAEPTQTDLFK
jgi:hypothetical protein